MLKGALKDKNTRAHKSCHMPLLTAVPRINGLQMFYLKIDKMKIVVQYICIVPD